ncbi:hypothetical protein PZ897_04595 [Hoeflea sp. YIM 152468]|uniref:hypothetical protein n=1 Tax=Hoeflea sp. YIM 152468 TaxID=3031759 RepID=UPI0023DC6CF4|nr:hypothetical protein [Hoeflea sp. YIM 152468]MDF1607447.1 hypothetical protein [Hoeflea sp. YIM 152468]
MATGIGVTLEKLWRHNRWLTVSFLITLTLALFFIIRAGVFFIYWQNHADEPIEGWMTVRYVARSYRVDPRIVHDAINLPEKTPDRRPLIKIAREQGRPLDALTAAIIHAVETDRAALGRPPGDASSPPAAIPPAAPQP